MPPRNFELARAFSTCRGFFCGSQSACGPTAVFRSFRMPAERRRTLRALTSSGPSIVRDRTIGDGGTRRVRRTCASSCSRVLQGARTRTSDNPAARPRPFRLHGGAAGQGRAARRRRPELPGRMSSRRRARPTTDGLRRARASQANAPGSGGKEASAGRVIELRPLCTVPSGNGRFRPRPFSPERRLHQPCGTRTLPSPSLRSALAALATARATVRAPPAPERPRSGRVSCTTVQRRLAPLPLSRAKEVERRLKLIRSRATPPDPLSRRSPTVLHDCC